jgi:hypothetical protein
MGGAGAKFRKVNATNPPPRYVLTLTTHLHTHRGMFYRGLTNIDGHRTRCMGCLNDGGGAYRDFWIAIWPCGGYNCTHTKSCVSPVEKAD